MMQWQDGPPTEEGFWIVVFMSGDHASWLCTMLNEPYEEENFPEGFKPYLEYHDAMDSGPVDWYHKEWGVKRSFGPLPLFVEPIRGGLKDERTRTSRSD